MKSYKGFTLVEVMVVVAIVGILAAIAWPSYQDTVRKSNRTEAKTELLLLAQRLQKCYSAYKRYDDPPGDNSCAVFDSLDSGNYFTSGKALYIVAIAAVPPAAQRNSFILTATADKMPQTADVGCEVLTLTHTGQKEPANCW